MIKQFSFFKVFIFIVLLCLGVYILFFIFSSFTGMEISSQSIFRQPTASYGKTQSSIAYDMAEPLMMPVRESAPVAGTNRMVIQNSTLSLLVQNVIETRDTILSYVTSLGGYMVNSSTTRPMETASATLTLRIPSNRLTEALEKLRSLSVKVISEELEGHDVTDSFIDVEQRIQQITASKRKMEEILNSAKEVSDIVNINNQILALQNQIDALRGQQISMQQNAELAKVTIFLSTDEIALPYAPDNAFRPQIIMKMAVRSVVGTLQKAASVIIWIAVYGIIWIPLAIIGFIIWKRFLKK